MDFFAIASMGAFPTPTPTSVQRAIYAVSYGLLDTAFAVGVGKGLLGFGFSMKFN